MIICQCFTDWMATPPFVGDQDAMAAIERIHRRHDRVDDKHREELTFDPADVLRYLRKYGSGMPDGVRADDLYDAVVLHVWLWWWHQLRELWLFDTAERLGLSFKDFGEGFGLRRAQSFRDRSDRLHALFDPGGPGRPDEQAVRADRGAGDSGLQVWLAAARGEIEAVAWRVVREWYPRVSEETAREMVDLRRDLRSGAFGPATWAALQDAVQALGGDGDPEARAAAAGLAQELARLEGRRELGLQSEIASVVGS